MVVWSQ